MNPLSIANLFKEISVKSLEEQIHKLPQICAIDICNPDFFDDTMNWYDEIERFIKNKNISDNAQLVFQTKQNGLTIKEFKKMDDLSKTICSILFDNLTDKNSLTENIMNEKNVKDIFPKLLTCILIVFHSISNETKCQITNECKPLSRFTGTFKICNPSPVQILTMIQTPYFIEKNNTDFEGIIKRKEKLLEGGIEISDPIIIKTILSILYMICIHISKGLINTLKIQEYKNINDRPICKYDRAKNGEIVAYFYLDTGEQIKDETLIEAYNNKLIPENKINCTLTEETKFGGYYKKRKTNKHKTNKHKTNKHKTNKHKTNKHKTNKTNKTNTKYLLRKTKKYTNKQKTDSRKIR